MPEQGYTCYKEKTIDKLETIVEKLKDTTAIIAKTTAVHTEKLSHINEELEELFDSNKSIHVNLDELEKEIQDNSSFSNKLLAVHDEKLRRMSLEIKELFNSSRIIGEKIELLQSEIRKEMNILEKHLDEESDTKSEDDATKIESIKENFKSEITKLDDRIKTLESYKYIIVGGVVICSYIIDHIDFLSNLVPK